MIRALGHFGYFPTCMIGYLIGLETAFIMGLIFRVAQPALLYIVPCTLGERNTLPLPTATEYEFLLLQLIWNVMTTGPLLVASALKGELGDVWHGPRPVMVDPVYQEIKPNL